MVNSNAVTLFSGENIPLEMHKVRMVQNLKLLPIKERLTAIQEAGNNTFLLRNSDVFLDMLTDSGVNAMSDRQYAAMMTADDSYAGSQTFYRLEKTLQDFFGTKFFLPAHQGRACENIIASSFVKSGNTTIMNYHFTTTKAFITLNGGAVEEAICDDGICVDSNNLFKGNIDIQKLKNAVDKAGAENVAFVRVEAGTNLVGGQPVSLKNMIEVTEFCRKHNLLTVLDASLLADNLYFIKTREQEYINMPISEIVRTMAKQFDIIYFSARKLGCARGGGICTSSEELYQKMRGLIPLYEGFLTYGGMSVREMEAISIGLQETLDINVISQTPIFVEALSNEMKKAGVPLVTPSGGLGCHIDAMRFVDHIPQSEYPAGALAAAIYLSSGVRGMERGTLSEQRNSDGSEPFANMELVRLALPKRVFTLSQVKYTADRVSWLYKNRKLIGGLEFVEEPSTLRFFFGRLKAKTNWQERLVEQFLNDMPSGL